MSGDSDELAPINQRNDTLIFDEDPQLTICAPDNEDTTSTDISINHKTLSNDNDNDDENDNGNAIENGVNACKNNLKDPALAMKSSSTKSTVGGCGASEAMADVSDTSNNNILCEICMAAAAAAAAEATNDAAVAGASSTRSNYGRSFGGLGIAIGIGSGNMRGNYKNIDEENGNGPSSNSKRRSKQINQNTINRLHAMALYDDEMDDIDDYGKGSPKII